MLHRIAHWFGWNVGTVETWWDPGPLALPGQPKPKLMVGFRCSTCGRLSGVDEAHLPDLP